MLDYDVAVNLHLHAQVCLCICMKPAFMRLVLMTECTGHDVAVSRRMVTVHMVKPVWIAIKVNCRLLNALSQWHQQEYSDLVAGDCKCKIHFPGQHR